MPEYKNPSAPSKRERNALKDYFALGPVLGYFFRKSNPSHKPNFNLRMMHGINKISIIMFLIGMIFFVIKIATR